MKTGVMLMSEKGPDGQPTDWRRMLAVWRDAGVEQVDVFDRMLQTVGASVQEMKRLLDDLGLSASVFCVPTDLVSPDAATRAKSLDTIRRGLDSCAFFGVTHLFSHGGQHNNEGPEALARYADGLGRAADLAAKAGMVLSIENAGKMCHTDTELLKCLEMTGRPNLKITLDGGNFILAGCDPLAAARRLADKVVHVHVKSFVHAPERTPRPFRYVPTGEGAPDYRVIRDTLRAAGFDACMSFEPEGGFDSKWEQSIRTLRGIVEEAR